MRAKPLLIVSLGLVAAGIGLLLLQRREPEVGTTPADELLEPLVESPRPPVQAEPPRPTLKGRPSPLRKAGQGSDRAALLEERNDLAREHGHVVGLYEAGRVTLQDVEAAEMQLLDARHRLGEMDGPTWHRARAVLVARAVVRTNFAVEAGRVPAADLERVRLSLELERLLAGDPDTYAASRDASFAALKDRNATMVMAGRASAKTLQVELEKLEAEFPPADVAKAQDR